MTAPDEHGWFTDEHGWKIKTMGLDDWAREFGIPADEVEEIRARHPVPFEETLDVEDLIARVFHGGDPG